MLDNFPEGFRRNDEDVLNEFRQKQVNFDLEERRNEIDNSRSLFIGALAGLAMAGIVGWVVLAPRYQNNAPENVPLITRPQEPAKILPAVPGDVELSSQERGVYSILEKKAENNNEANIVESAEPLNTQAVEKLIEREAEPVQAPQEAESLAQIRKKPLPDKMVETSDSQVEKTAVVSEEVKALEPAKVAEPAKVVEPVKVTEPVKVVAPSVVKPILSAANGNWQIQLMSSPNRAAVEKSWLTMSAKYAKLKDMPHEIESADLGAKGTFYRLKAGAFASKDAATNFCTELKSAGGSCFTVKK